MEPTEVYEDAVACAKKAVDKMGKMKILPYPRNFTIWYTHFSGKYPDLSAFLTKGLERDGYFDEDRNTLIYQKFFGFDQLSRKIREVTSLSGRVLGDALEGLKTFRDESKETREVLKVFNMRLEKVEDCDEFKDLAVEILARVRNLESAAEAMETRLNTDFAKMVELHRSVEESQRESMTDALTGIANRNLFDSVLRLAARNPQKSQSLSVILMDVDGLRTFNESHGIEGGDAILCGIAKALTETVKGRDLAARYGDDEFVVLASRTRLSDAVKLAVTIRGAYNTSTGPLEDEIVRSLEVPITFSIGVAEYEPGESLARFMDRVNLALNTAKTNGRNQIISAEKTSQGIMLWDEDHMIVNPSQPKSGGGNAG